jgi:hypothetical protein
MARNLITLPWNGEWPGRIEDGLPTFDFRMAPSGLATRRQLRARGLCPGRQQYVAQLKWRAGRRWAALYRVDLAAPKRIPTAAQRAALGRAMASRRICRLCGTDVGFYLPRSAGRRCWPCAQTDSRPSGHSAKNARQAGAPNTRESGENSMVGNSRTVDTAAVTRIQNRLASAGTSRFLAVDRGGRCVRINLWTLALLVNDILTDHTTALQRERDEAVRESRVREDEIVALYEIERLRAGEQ